MNKPPRPELHNLVRRAAAVAVEASRDGLDPPTAVIAAAIHVAFPPYTSQREIADWLRRLAHEFEAH